MQGLLLEVVLRLELVNHFLPIWMGPTFLLWFSQLLLNLFLMLANSLSLLLYKKIHYYFTGLYIERLMIL